MNGTQTKNQKWYVASQNDCIFIINTKPHPVPVDHVNPNASGPSLIISMRSSTPSAQEIAERIVAAHNACFDVAT